MITLRTAEYKHLKPLDTFRNVQAMWQKTTTTPDKPTSQS